MINIISICGIAVLAIFLTTVLKQLKNDYAIILSIVFGIILLKYSIELLQDKFTYFSSILKNTTLGEFGNVILKTFGVSLVVGTVSDICKDAGENTIASKIEMIGKVEILLISIPLIERILEITKDIML